VPIFMLSDTNRTELDVFITCLQSHHYPICMCCLKAHFPPLTLQSALHVSTTLIWHPLLSSDDTRGAFWKFCVVNFHIVDYIKSILQKL
jgi:hypothetical protein